MTEQTLTHPIPFDSAQHPNFADLGLPYRIRLVLDEREIPVSIHVAGVFEAKIVNEPLYRLAAPSDEELSGSLLSALARVLAEQEGGLPEQLLLRGGTLRFAVEPLLSDDWLEHYGLALRSLVFTDCRLIPEDREKLDKLLLGEAEPEPPAGAETQSGQETPPAGRKLSPSQADMQKALEELNAKRKAQTKQWKNTFDLEK